MAWPPELMDSRPYSSGPLSRWNPVIMNMFPARGGSYWADSANTPVLEHMQRAGFSTGPVYPLVHMCFFAPTEVQKAYALAGGSGVVMQRVPGLAEALGFDPDQQTSMRVADPLMDAIEGMMAPFRASLPKAPPARGRQR